MAPCGHISFSLSVCFRTHLSELLWEQLYQVQSDGWREKRRDEVSPPDQNAAEQGNHHVHACRSVQRAEGNALTLTLNKTRLHAHIIHLLCSNYCLTGKSG